MKKLIVLSTKVLFLLSCLVSLNLATAADWPSKSIKLTVAYGAGGTTDLTARVLASILEQELDTTVTVLNKPGGGGSVAAGLGKIERPDGYSLFTVTTGAAILSPHMQDLPYDSLKDFTYISQFAQWNLGVVVPKDAPYNTMQEFIAFAKENPGEVSYAISGTGTPQHLTMQRLAGVEEIDWKVIPYKGGADAVTALLGGHVDAMAGATEWLPQVESGDFKLLGILTDKRMAQFPDVPTLLDLGYDISAPSILGIAGPANIPDDVVAKIDSSIKAATENQELQAIIEKLAMQIKYLDHEAFTQSIAKEYTTQGEVIKQSGLGK